jgi:F-type H+-transporting ATPase subunit gamma
MIGIREFNKKITSLKNTKKMTKTMKMVAASKFKRAYKAQSGALAYADELTGLMKRLSQNDAEAAHPLLAKPKNVQNVLILLFTSDKGLCGGFNNNLVRYVRSWINANQEKYKFIDMSFCGRRGFMSLRRQVSVNKNYEDVSAKPSFANAVKIADDLAQAYIGQKYDEIYIAYNHFKNPLSQVPVLEKLVPFDSQLFMSEQVQGVKADYIFEPQATELFDLLVPKYLNFKIYFALLENSVGEHGARMTAMDKATENTGELIDKYILLRNRARQAAITTELIEIISGAEALNN